MIRNVRVYDLRHTFASHLVMAGVPLYTVSELMGHERVEMTKRYAHLAPRVLQSAVSVLNFGASPGQAKVVAIR